MAEVLTRDSGSAEVDAARKPGAAQSPSVPTNQNARALPKDPAAPALVDNHQGPPDYASKKWAFRDPNHLMKLFLDPEISLDRRMDLTSQIGQHPTPNNIEVLNKTIRDPLADHDLKLDATRALVSCYLEVAKSRDELIKSLESIVFDATLSGELRSYAVGSYLSSISKELFQTSKNLLSNPDLPVEIRVEAARALAYEGRESLKQFAFDPDVPEPARVSALRYLTALNDSSALPQLQAIAENTDGESAILRLAAAKCGMQLEPDKFMPSVLKLAENADFYVSNPALDLLRLRAPKEMIACVGKIIQSPEATAEQKAGAIRALESGPNQEGRKVYSSARQFLSLHLDENAVSQFVESVPLHLKFSFKADSALEPSVKSYDAKLMSGTFSVYDTPGYLKALKAEKDPRIQQIARKAITTSLETQPDPFGDYGLGLAIDAIKGSNDLADITTLFRVLRDERVSEKIRLAAGADLGKESVGDIEKLMLNTSNLEVVIGAAKALYKVDPSRGIAALKQLLYDPSTKSEAASLCATINDPQSMDLLALRTLTAVSSNFASKSLFIAVGNALNKANAHAGFAAAIEKLAGEQPNVKRGEFLRTYAAAILKGKEIGIDNPLRMDPESLCKIVKNRTESADTRMKDTRPVAVIVLPKSDHNGFAYGIREGIQQLNDKGYRVMLYEAHARDQIVNAAKDGAPKKGAELMVFLAHSSWDGMSFGGKDPTTGSKVNASNGISVQDYKELVASGLGQCLAEKGRILLIGCSVGADGKDADNVANMFRAIAPQAMPGGIQAPRFPTTLERFIFDRDGKAVDFEGSSERYQASRDWDEDLLAVA